MKYIKKFEDADTFENININDSKFKVGDYVSIIYRYRKGIVSEVFYSNIQHCMKYKLEGIDNIYFREEEIRLLTPYEIEKFKWEQITNKFNI